MSIPRNLLRIDRRSRYPSSDLVTPAHDSLSNVCRKMNSFTVCCWRYVDFRQVHDGGMYQLMLMCCLPGCCDSHWAWTFGGRVSVSRKSWMICSDGPIYVFPSDILLTGWVVCFSLFRLAGLDSWRWENATAGILGRKQLKDSNVSSSASRMGKESDETSERLGSMKDLLSTNLLLLWFAER